MVATGNPNQGFTSYTVDNDKKFRDAVKAAGDMSQDLRVPFGLILRDFYKSEQSIFKLQGPGQYPPFKNSVRASHSKGGKDENGKRFKKGSEYTAAMSPYQKWKKKHFGFDYPLLVRTGRLASSLLGPNNPGSISLVTKLTLAFGTSVPYGIYHQSDDPRKVIPLRKFLFIGPEAPQFATSEQQGRLQRWLGYIQDHVEAQGRKAFA